MSPFSILLFDPHPGLLGILVRHVEAQHAELLTIVGAAFRESDALTLAAATHPQVVLLETGGPMPHTVELIASLRRLLPSVIIVAIGHLGTAGYAQAALNAGADTFVDKDDLKARLGPAILEIAGARDRIVSVAPSALDTR